MKGIFIRPEKDTYPNVQLQIDWFIKESNSDVIKYDSNNPKDISSKINKLAKTGEYDYIIDWYQPALLDVTKSMGDIGLPYITHSGDCWGRLFSNRYKEHINKHKPSIIMINNKCSILAFKDYLDDNNIKLIWAPHSFDPEIMKDYGEDKIYDITFSGKFSNYDDRRNIHNYLSRRTTTKRDITYRRLKNQTLDEYLKNMNRSWMVISSMQNSDLLYYKTYFIGNCFSRNFEIPACNSCLIIRRFGDAKDLGFEDGVNCILFDKLRDFPKKIEYYLDDKELLMKITRNGYDLVHKNHTISTHTKALIKRIEKAIR